MVGMAPDEYFDLGALQSWNFMDWNTGQVNVTNLDTYLASYAAQCKSQGITETTMSFGQVCDIGKLTSGDFSSMSHSDSLWMLAQNTGGSSIDGMSVFQYMVHTLSQNGIKVDLSFGGEAATSSDWDFGFGTTPPATLASELASWAQKMGLNGVDFDVETGAISSNGASDLATFFSDFHSAMAGDGMPVTLTVMGDASTWGLQGSVFGGMFAAGKAEGKTFQDMFDGLNLMLYNGQYYLNAGQSPPQSWDLTTWVSNLMENTGLSAGACASYLNIGFNAKINYADPSSSGGPLPYSNMPSGLSNGQAAAYIYDQITEELQKYFNDPSLSLGQPFFWDDNANYNVGENGDYSSQFFSSTGNFEKDFTQYLKQLLREKL